MIRSIMELTNNIILFQTIIIIIDNCYYRGYWLAGDGNVAMIFLKCIYRTRSGEPIQELWLIN